MEDGGLTATKTLSPGADLPKYVSGLEQLRQAEEDRLAGVPGIPAEEVIAELGRIRAKYSVSASKPRFAPRVLAMPYSRF